MPSLPEAAQRADPRKWDRPLRGYSRRLGAVILLARGRTSHSTRPLQSTSSAARSPPNSRRYKIRYVT